MPGLSGAASFIAPPNQRSAFGLRSGGNSYSCSRSHQPTRPGRHGCTAYSCAAYGSTTYRYGCTPHGCAAHSCSAHCRPHRETHRTTGCLRSDCKTPRPRSWGTRFG